MLGVKKLDPSAKLPVKAFLDDAGFDVFSIEDVEIYPNETVIVSTGIALEIPKGMWVQVLARSSMAKNGVDVKAGVLDAGYTGLVSVILKNDNIDKHYFISKGDKIAQLVYHRTEPIGLVEVTELPSSERGNKAFGSSGK